MGGILFLILIFAFIYFFGEAIGEMVGGTIILMIGAPLALLPATLFLYVLKLGVGFHLDFGQIMTFSILITSFIFLLLRKMNEINSDFFPKNLFDYNEINSKSIAQIITFGAVFLAILLVLQFGFHSKFPSAYAKWAFNGDQVTETTKENSTESLPSNTDVDIEPQINDLEALQNQINEEDKQTQHANIEQKFEATQPVTIENNQVPISQKQSTFDTVSTADIIEAHSKIPAQLGRNIALVFLTDLEEAGLISGEAICRAKDGTGCSGSTVGEGICRAADGTGCSGSTLGEGLCRAADGTGCSGSTVGEGICRAADGTGCSGSTVGEGICRAADGTGCSGSTLGEGICRAADGTGCSGSTLGEGICRAADGTGCSGSTLGEGICRAFNGTSCSGADSGKWVNFMIATYL